jgi:hypothetical protein
MTPHLTTSYMAQQTDRMRLDRRSAVSWTAPATPPSGGLRANLVTIVLVAAIGLGGTTAALAHDRSGLPDGVRAEFAAAGVADETVPARPWDGRPW